MLLLLPSLGRAEVTPDWAAEHLGVYLWPTYPRLEGYTLPELLSITEALGPRVVRLTLEAHFGREADWVSLLRAPAVRECVARFPTVILTLSDHSGRQYEPAWTQAQYERLTEHLLETYRDPGKTIILGLWETDHWLKLDAEGLGFLRARQEGIQRARQRLGEGRAQVLCMVEVTKADGECVATELLPQAVPEVLSLSWWAHAQEVGPALGRLKALVPQARLMVGEMGLSNRRRDPDRAARLLVAIDEAREAGAEWVILWRLDDWEYGLTEARPEGGDVTDLWRAIWPLFHGGEPCDRAEWRRTNGTLRQEARLTGGRAEVSLGPEGAERLIFRTEAGAREVTFAGDGQQALLASFLPPQARIELSADGRGCLQIGPIRADSPDDWQPWRVEGLTWNREFAVWQPAARGAEGFIELEIEADYPILGGSLWLTGRRAAKGDWGAQVRGYQGEWLDCPEVYDWRGEQLLAQFPATFPSEWGPTRRVALRFWIRADDEGADWVWTTSLTSLRVSAALDTRAAAWPSEGELRWTSDGEAAAGLAWISTDGPR